MGEFYGLDHPNKNNSQYNVKRRNPNGKLSGLIVMHTAECRADLVGPDTSAEGVANFISTRKGYGSYHRIIDSDSVVKYLPYLYEAFHDTTSNHYSVGLSFAVMAGDWNKYPPAFVEAILRNGAAMAADAVKQIKTLRGIDVPLKRISRAEAVALKPGFVGHGTMDPGRRSDPGANFPWDRFLQYVGEALGSAEPLPTVKDDEMLLIRNNDTGAVYFISGGKSVPVTGPDYAAFQKIAPVLGLSAEGFRLMLAGYPT